MHLKLAGALRSQIFRDGWRPPTYLLSQVRRTSGYGVHLLLQLNVGVEGPEVHLALES